MQDVGELAGELAFEAGLQVGGMGAGAGVGTAVAGHTRGRRAGEGQELRDAAVASGGEEPALILLSRPVVDTFDNSNVSTVRHGWVMDGSIPAPMLKRQQESPMPLSEEKSRSATRVRAASDQPPIFWIRQPSEAPKFSISW